VENGEVQARCTPGFTPHTVAWHPDGKGLAVGGGGGGLALWEPSGEPDTALAGSLRRFNGHFGRVVELSFSPDGSLLLSSAWGDFSTLWDARSGRRLLVDPRAALRHFGADGTRFAVEATRRLIRTTVPFLGRTGFRAVVQAGLEPRAAGGVAFSPDGRYAATDHINVTCLWDSSSGRELTRVAGRSSIFLPDNQSLLTCTERGVFRFDLPSAGIAPWTSNRIDGVEILHRNRAKYPNEAFNSLALAPDGRTLVICANDAGVVLFDLVEARIIRRFTNVLADYSSISADGNWLVTQLHNGPAYLVPVTNTTSPIYLGLHFNTAFSPDGNRLAIATGEALSLLERNVSNRWVRTCRVPVDLGLNAVASMAFTSDSKALAVTVNRFDIRLLVPANGRELATFTAPFDTPIEGGRSLEFSPDGRFLRALRQGGEVIEWDIPVVRGELAKLGLDWNEETPTPAVTKEADEPGSATKQVVGRVKDSPLTPALSPLRGEGVAMDARGENQVRSRVPAAENGKRSPASARGVHAASSIERLTTTNAARDNRFTERDGRAPSPLNGERAGVRGENSAGHPFNSAGSSLPAAAAAAAALLALLAGMFVFVHQRKLLAGYAQAERLAAERQQQLGQAQAALFQSQKMEALGTLAAGVAHDFNNLLSIIRMSKQLVDRAVKPEGVTKENLEAIEQAVHQGKSLVNSMLGYSRRPTEAIEDFSVVKVVGDTVALLSRQFLGGLTLNLQLDQSCPPIHGSRARLEQALLNLIVNASEAMTGSGALTIKARPMDASAPAANGVLQPKDASGGVELSVSDTGPGIPPDALPRIFEPFFTTKTVGTQRGTGLGLSLVYALAKQDGWGLGVQTAPGGGTTFTLSLPASQTALSGRRLPTSQGSDVSGRLDDT
jgi:signal transduction histidine kinase/WD40 repeat protein